MSHDDFTRAVSTLRELFARLAPHEQDGPHSLALADCHRALYNLHNAAGCDACREPQNR